MVSNLRSDLSCVALAATSDVDVMLVCSCRVHATARVGFLIYIGPVPLQEWLVVSMFFVQSNMWKEQGIVQLDRVTGIIHLVALWHMLRAWPLRIHVSKPSLQAEPIIEFLSNKYIRVRTFTACSPFRSTLFFALVYSLASILNPCFLQGIAQSDCHPDLSQSHCCFWRWPPFWLKWRWLFVLLSA